METLKNYLLDCGFQINSNNCDSGINLEFTYTKLIDGFASYNVSIISHTNWFFTMEIEKLSLSNSVVGYPRYTCFKGIISSKNTIHILKTILTATGIKGILEC